MEKRYSGELFMIDLVKMEYMGYYANANIEEWYVYAHCKYIAWRRRYDTVHCSINH